jgi:hypothetical protein
VHCQYTNAELLGIEQRVIELDTFDPDMTPETLVTNAYTDPYES